jgi:hypothetical protein
MPDVHKTANQNNGNVLEAKVQGITLKLLLQCAILHFDQNVDGSKSGGSLRVKIDIEGAEFVVLK